VRAVANATEVLRVSWEIRAGLPKAVTIFLIGISDPHFLSFYQPSFEQMCPHDAAYRMTGETLFKSVRDPKSDAIQTAGLGK
jgi:hypothetical protein